MADLHEPKNTTIVLLGILASLFFFVMIIGLLYYFNRMEQSQIHAKIELAPTTKLRELRAYEDERLHQYAHASDDKNIIHIPIERAMELEASGPWRQNVRLSGEAGVLKTEDGGTSHGTP